jgi:23S rRNA pseudouridine1911/1915/1917 synthase
VTDPTESLVLVVGEAHHGVRLDAFLTARLPWRSRRSVVQLIVAGAVDVNAVPAKKARRVVTGDRVALQVPAEDPASHVADLDIEVLYEDDELVVVNKPAGLSVHPASTCLHRNLLGWLQHRSLPEATSCGVPSVVHRLDRTTSGAIAFAKRRDLVAEFAQQFERRQTEKRYEALVHGQPEASGSIRLPLRVVDLQPVTVGDDGKPSHTDYTTLETTGAYSRLRVALHTGRKHQIRVHLAAIGHPIVGDHLYGPPPPVSGGPFLHAASLTLRHHGQARTFEAPVPAHWDDAWRALGGDPVPDGC